MSGPVRLKCSFTNQKNKISAWMKNCFSILQLLTLYAVICQVCGVSKFLSVYEYKTIDPF